jgi:hypothetical protein
MIRDAYAAAMRLCGPGAARDGALTLAAFCGAAACAFTPLVLLFWLMQPKVLANPGPHGVHIARYAYPEPPPRDAAPTHAAAPSPVRPLKQADAQLRPEPRGQRQAQARPDKSRRVVAMGPVRTHSARIDAAPGPLTPSRSSPSLTARSDTFSSL